MSLNQWITLTPPELVWAHLNLDQQTLAVLRRDKPILVVSQQQRRKHKHSAQSIQKTFHVL